VGARVGVIVGDFVGGMVGAWVGADVLTMVGDEVVLTVGAWVELTKVGDPVAFPDRVGERVELGAELLVGANVGADVFMVIGGVVMFRRVGDIVGAIVAFDADGDNVEFT
jgi:hypothetical protein